MTRCFVALLAAVAMSAIAPATLGFGSLSAASLLVIHDRWEDSFSFVENDGCAFPVTVSGTANIDDAIFFDDDGEFVRLLSTVNHAEILFSANGITLTAKGSGGVEYTANPDGTVTAQTFGINLLMTIPHYGVIQLDTGRAEYLSDGHGHTEEVFHAGPSSYDQAAFCAALSGN